MAKARRMHGYCAIAEEAFVAWNGCNCSPREEVDTEADMIHCVVIAVIWLQLLCSLSSLSSCKKKGKNSVNLKLWL